MPEPGPSENAAVLMAALRSTSITRQSCDDGVSRTGRGCSMRAAVARLAAVAARTVGAFSLLFLAGVAGGADNTGRDNIVIEPGDCGSGVRLIARNARLGDVLARL